MYCQHDQVVGKNPREDTHPRTELKRRPPMLMASRHLIDADMGKKWREKDAHGWKAVTELAPARTGSVRRNSVTRREEKFLKRGSLDRVGVVLRRLLIFGNRA